ncbi:hypothetical protein ACVCL0_10140 [Rhodanobacter sp. UC4450_H17]
MRVGIVPASQGGSDRIRKDEKRNLIVCPLPYDQSFMEVFFSAWGIVQQFVHADAQMPKDVALPIPSHRQVCRELVTRREFPVVDVIQALLPLAQPELLITDKSTQKQTVIGSGALLLDGLISPVPRRVS